MLKCLLLLLALHHHSHRRQVALEHEQPAVAAVENRK